MSQGSKITASYTRVSTADQNTDRQFADSLPFGRSYVDKISGIVPFAERPAGKRLLEDVLKGEIGEIHFHEVSRVGRDISDVTVTLQFFIKQGIQVVIKKEGIRLLNDDGKVNPTAQLVLSVMTALSSIERTNIRERQLEGIAIAKAKGKYLGRRHGSREPVETFLAKPKSQRIAQMLMDHYPATHVAKLLGVSYSTVAKVRRQVTLPEMGAWKARIAS